MTNKRSVEVFSAGCPVCEEAIQLVKDLACSSCDLSIRDMKEPEVAERAKALGIQRIPAVVIDGKLAECCAANGPDEKTLRAAGLGVALA